MAEFEENADAFVRNSLPQGLRESRLVVSVSSLAGSFLPTLVGDDVLQLSIILDSENQDVLCR